MVKHLKEQNIIHNLTSSCTEQKSGENISSLTEKETINRPNNDESIKSFHGLKNNKSSFFALQNNYQLGNSIDTLKNNEEPYINPNPNDLPLQNPLNIKKNHAIDLIENFLYNVESCVSSEESDEINFLNGFQSKYFEESSPQKEVDKNSQMNNITVEED